MRRLPHIAISARSIAHLLVAAAAIATGVAAGSSSAATGEAVVTLDVASSTTLVRSGCLPGTAATNLGVVQPGTTALTSADCLISWGSSNDTSSLRVGQRDGAGVAMASVSDGTLDPDFATGGVFSDDLGALSAAPVDHVTALDGAVLVNGSFDRGSGHVGELRRIAPDGTPDGTFNGGLGHVPAPSSEEGGPIAQLSGGRIAAGFGPHLLVRNADGTVNAAFAGGSLDLSTGAQTATDEIRWLGASGSTLLVVFRDDEPGGSRVLVRRYEPDGDLDTTFAVGGEHAHGPFANVSIRSATLVADGDLLVSGERSNLGYVLRLDRHGRPQTSFGIDGVALLDSTPGDEEFSSTIELPNGQLLVVNIGGSGSSHRLDPSGALDMTYGAGGIGAITYGDGAIALDLTDDGSGGAWVNLLFVPTAAMTYHSGVARIDGDGQLDTSFGGDGVVDLGATNYFQFGAVERGIDGELVAQVADFQMPGPVPHLKFARFDATTVDDYAGSWAGGSAFGMCMHTADAGVTPVWTLAGANNCTTAATANWNDVPATTQVVGTRAAPGVGSTTFRFGTRPDATQAVGTYEAPVAFEVVAP